MGNKCGACTRGEVTGQENSKPEYENNVEPYNAKHAENPHLTQKQLSALDDELHRKQTSVQTSHSQEQQSPCERKECGINSIRLENTAQEAPPSLSVPLDFSEKEREAKWVEKNRASLIQDVKEVMEIADELLQIGIIRQERYQLIKVTKPYQNQMRELFDALNSIEGKSAFYRLYKRIASSYENKEILIEALMKNKAYLREKCTWEFEGTTRARQERKLLDQIYTELHIVQGEVEDVNKQHEIWEIEDKFRLQKSEGIKIHCNDIFRMLPKDAEASVGDLTREQVIRAVMTKGIAGIGKTVSVKKFILDWADGKANRDLDAIFMFPFREINLVKDVELSLETFVKEFHPVLKPVRVTNILDNHKVLFIFDGLDESKLTLDFKNTEMLTDPAKKSSVDILVTNLIREHLLCGALVWITSRPGAVQRIPKQYICQWTEVRGFEDSQKIQYFRNRIEDKPLAEKMIKHITESKSLYIMCHIPIFCWMVSKVFEKLLQGEGNTQDGKVKIPTTIIEMYTHFFQIQIRLATEKYDKKSPLDIGDICKLNEEFIFKLGRMAFENLITSDILFTGDDLESYGIDLDKAGVYCGLCTAIFKMESVFDSKKLYCFVHLTVQEYFAALFVYRCFASKNIVSQSLKNFLLTGSDEELESILESNPVDLPLDELMEIAIANSTLRKTGELDMFLRFLIGMSLKSTQDLLQGLIRQTEEHSQIVEAIRTSLTEIDLLDCSPDRCLNLVHCLAELKDSTMHDSVRPFVSSSQHPDTDLSPVQCSALADLILMSNTPMEEFDMKKYTTAKRGFFRLVPAVRNCLKARISGVDLDPWICESVSSALWMPRSVLNELHLVHNTFYDKGTTILANGLKNALCKLEFLSLSGHGFSAEVEKELASAIQSVILNLRELELSDNILVKSLPSVISDGLRSEKLEKLRLNGNTGITQICQQIEAAFIRASSKLRVLELCYSNLKDSDMAILSNALKSSSCTLETLILSHNKLTAKGCETLASALCFRASAMKELDLSYNDLQDDGVKRLCHALTTPLCTLEKLRLSFCKVTVDKKCSLDLASALTSKHCKLKEMDLSFNYLTNEGVTLLGEKLTDPCCSLEILKVDHNEACWVDLKLLRQYACDLTLDPNTAGPNIILTEENKTAEYTYEKQSYEDHPERFSSPQVLCEEGLTGRHYWEVDCSSCTVGVAYKSIPRTGDSSNDFSLGTNLKSWGFSDDFSFSHNGSTECLLWKPTKNLGVFLDWPGGILAFFDASSDLITHLYTVHTTFTEPLFPGFSLDGYVKIKPKHEW